MVRHLRIVGIVQGVGYRAAFARNAKALKLSGWVRNRADGSVEAIVSGAVDALDQLIDWAHRGPPGARVSAVSAAEAADTDVTADHFEILPTK